MSLYPTKTADIALPDGHDTSPLPTLTGRPSLKGQRDGLVSEPEYPVPPPDHHYRASNNPSPLSTPTSSSELLKPNLKRFTSEARPASEASGSYPYSGDDTLTLRRREANRLAAQRFRSRKKGYQDSLEERVRQLEDERDVLLRRLGESPEKSSRGTFGMGFEEDEVYHSIPRNGLSPGVPHLPIRTALPILPIRSDSPEGREPSIDIELRMVALESANRSLQDELKGFGEENKRLCDEIESWRSWEREVRDNPSSSRDGDHHVSEC